MTSTEPAAMLPVSSPLYAHTVWCTGAHDPQGECIKDVAVAQESSAAVVRLNGVPGDHQYIEVNGCLVDAADVDAAVRILTDLRADLVAQDQVEPQLDWDAYDQAQADNTDDTDGM